ncbi:MAG: ATP-dependent Clp protease ATP-binding subunit [Parcubacteria group bacterium]|nr:ATP-dependent Clp protease ATP-binding subunit [Parcubacteria group bacterium]
MSTTSKFTKNLSRVIEQACLFAMKKNKKTVDLAEVVDALLFQKKSLASQILHQHPALIKKTVLSANHENLPERIPDFSEELSRALGKATIIAYVYEHRYLGTEHLLAALLELFKPSLGAMLGLGVSDLHFLEQKIIAVLKNTSKLPDLEEILSMAKEKQTLRKEYSQKTSTSYLDTCTENITQKAFEKKLDPCVARDAEINRIIQILGRRRKNNPILLGQPGVGKTAIVEGLASRIVRGDVPDFLKRGNILSLDTSALVAGSFHRGEFEYRLKYLLNEIQKNPNLILFIDEIHTILGIGSHEGSVDMANILKPSLARGEIRCIGATTFDDYRKYFERDAALTRRFQPIHIHEPSTEETALMLKNMKKVYEQFHKVKISDDAIQSTVKLADSHIPERFFPDKALDVIDEAASQLKLSMPQSALERKLSELTAKMVQMKDKKREALLAENFLLTKKFKTQEKKMEMQLQKISSQIQSAPSTMPLLSSDHIGQTISMMTHIPLDHFHEKTENSYRDLEKKLLKKIIGQEKAIQNIAKAVRIHKAGIREQERPLSLLFIGPAGVGKTAAAKAVADILYPNASSFLRLDMSEYTEAFHVSKLIGAPAGYIGYRESGLLSNFISENPHAVIVFDRMEKAHPDVKSIVLQLIDEGGLRDAAGKKVNAKNSIFIFTVATSSKEDSVISGFEKNDDLGRTKKINTSAQSCETAKKIFSSEFMDMLGEIIEFRPFDKKDLLAFAKNALDQIRNHLLTRGKNITFDEKVYNTLIQHSEDTNISVKTLKKHISDRIEESLADLLLTHHCEHIHVGVKKEKITFKLKKHDSRRSSKSGSR